jgi:ActR/RegA family two-component response regulator
LVVEDDDAYQRVLVRAFQPFGFDLKQAYTNGQAAAIIEEGFLLAGATVDIELPDGPGFKTMERIRRTFPTIGFAGLCLRDAQRLRIEVQASE